MIFNERDQIAHLYQYSFKFGLLNGEPVQIRIHEMIAPAIQVEILEREDYITKGTCTWFIVCIRKGFITKQDSTHQPFVAQNLEQTLGYDRNVRPAVYIGFTNWIPLNS